MDETVVKRDGRPLYVWVGVNAQTIKPIWFGVSFTQTTQNSNSSKSEKNLLWQSCVVLRDRGLVPWCYNPNKVQKPCSPNF
ncbi:hypothetical protein B9Q11_01630 [Candidatus Marsarchaeota G2 archaeon ECH_B_SAG-F08]|uniref:DDE domain-containing protein n=3 Tax=Candidatus Marsarchaeota TaxID=1978152 RepID=A0A2R6AKM3_9ARCH|nr:MAG: hypothetical protein B9Q02_00505 [Candidatus Marsarchaeota G1 archaeon BE_D]PSN88844.1 MAG: hypothetical protein B9P99_05710 [Candidatus Marsarchaeota G1 archaeon OSP_B]PSN98939.1 MAG: hypothetical protein B9Q11_01630 [Candidatus Marsarchaeota G2 archaeon ECH_B_SAG-F08]